MKLKTFYLRLSREHLQEDETKLNEFISTVKVEQIETHLVDGKVNFWSVLVFYDQMGSVISDSENIKLEIPKTKTQKTAPKTTSSPFISTLSPDDLTLNEEEEILYDLLRRWRTQTADSQNVANYMVAHNSELIRIVKSNPNSTEDIHKIKTWKGEKSKQYAQEVWAIIEQNRK
jgi:superfamily II DNA helicase RecQ